MAEQSTRKITFYVSRFDTCRDENTGAVLKKYTVSVHEGARVLDVLIAIRDTIDPTLSFRYCCGAGQCGSCAVRVNSEPKLACMTEAKDNMIIEPLELPVIKDLVVDMVQFLKDMPGLVPSASSNLPSKEDIDKIKPIRDCIECLCCVSVCPAMDVTEFDGPAFMRQEMRLALDPRDERNRIPLCVSDEGLFTCTSCQACWKVCPKDIEIPGKAIEKLRELANRQGLTLPRHQEVAKLVEDTGRSVERQDITLFEQIPEVIEPYGEVKREAGFFTGCLYNLRLPQTALDAIEVLKRNGVRIIVPKDQVCCGSPLIRTGQTAYLSKLKQKNIDCFEKRGIKTVLTMCAGCGSTLKNDYETPYDVIDINELLTDLGIEAPEKLDVKVTYHDPCHLLRGQGIKDEPRKLLEMVAGEFTEMPVKCCGSGGGVKSGLPDEAKALGAERSAEIDKTGCDVVVTSCPFCEFHIMSCTDKPVKNINTLLLEGYKKKDEIKRAEK